MVDHADASRYRRWSSRGLHLLVVSARPMAYDNFCHRLAAHSREGQHQHRHLSSHGQMLLSSTGRWFTKARITKHPGKPKSKVNLCKGCPFGRPIRFKCQVTLPFDCVQGSSRSHRNNALQQVSWRGACGSAHVNKLGKETLGTTPMKLHHFQPSFCPFSL